MSPAAFAVLDLLWVYQRLANYGGLLVGIGDNVIYSSLQWNVKRRKILADGLFHCVYTVDEYT